MSIPLFCNPSPGLKALYQANQVPLDGIECTPYQSLQEIESLRKVFAGLPFQFHASNMGRTPFTRGRLDRFQAACPESRWVSLHLAPLSPMTVYAGLRWSIHLPQQSDRRLEARLLRRIKGLQSGLKLPVILENMPANEVLDNPMESDPVMIRRVLDETGCDLLLDLAHAKVAAAFREVSAEAYLSEIPLEKVRQIHISGSRYRERGILQDAHEPLHEDDYALLAWTLERARPEMLTLEYFKDDSDALRRMLIGLRSVLDAATASGLE